MGLNVTKTNMVVSAADKPQDFIIMPEAFIEATKLPGIPMGVTTIIHGHSNTGKSLLKNCLIASAQRQGIMPVIIETENNFSWQFAIDCGVKAEPVYGDVEVEEMDFETGEIKTHTENRIINYIGDFMYFDSEMIVNMYGDVDHAKGVRVSKKRTVPVIEDVAMLVKEILDDQEDGKLPMPLLFIWDSVGSIPCYASLVSSKGNSQWDAKALQDSFNILLNNRIPSSKKVSSPYTNTFVAVNKIWLDSMSVPGAAPSVQLKGGTALLYPARLTILLGGSIKAATQKLQATSKGEKYTYGLKTKIKVVKNQLDSPYNLTYEGTFCCVPDGMVSENKLDEYKKEHIGKILKQLSQQLSEGGKESEITEADVQFSEEEGDD